MKTFVKEFNRNNLNWEKCAKFNELFLKSQLNYYQDVLQCEGLVFLKDLYVSFGLPITRESCKYGWYSGGNKNRFVNVTFKQINDYDFEITFKCYPVLHYLEKEEA